MPVPSILLCALLLAASCGEDAAPKPSTGSLTATPKDKKATSGYKAVGTSVVYGKKADLNPIEGYFTRSAFSSDSYAGVLVLHDHFGLNNGIKQMADIYSDQGYHVLSLDFFNLQVTDDEVEAKKRAQEFLNLTLQDGLLHIWLGIQYLRNQAKVEKIAVVGFGFGGLWATRAAIYFSDDISAVVDYYGIPYEIEGIKTGLKASYLGLFGQLDADLPVADIVDFQEKLKGSPIDASIRIFNDEERGFGLKRDNGFTAGGQEAHDATLALLKEKLAINRDPIPIEEKKASPSP